MPRCVLLPNVWATLREYAQECGEDLECSGIGRCEVDGGDLLVTDVVLLEQVCSPASSSIDGSQAALLEVDDLKDWVVWWHSHGGMEPYWSAIDEDNIKGLLRGGAWRVSLVVNRDMKARSRLDIVQPVVARVDMEVVVGLPSRQREALRKEVLEKVVNVSAVGDLGDLLRDTWGLEEELRKEDEKWEHNMAGKGGSRGGRRGRRIWKCLSSDAEP